MKCNTYCIGVQFKHLFIIIMADLDIIFQLSLMCCISITYQCADFLSSYEKIYTEHAQYKINP